MRLTGVPEWSVEYDQLTVVIWVSTAVADYKLLAPAAPYEPFWQVLQRKTALAARAIGLLIENPALTLKQLRGQIIKLKCAAEPLTAPDVSLTPPYAPAPTAVPRRSALNGALKLNQDEFLMHADFVAEQIAGAEGLAECRALLTLREQLGKSVAPGAPGASSTAAEPADPNKRARKAPTTFLSELESGEQKKGKSPRKESKDPHAPKPAQPAFFYFSKQCRDDLKKEAAGQGVDMASFGDVAKVCDERWQALSEEERAPYEETANVDHERCGRAPQALRSRRRALVAAAASSPGSPLRERRRRAPAPPAATAPRTNPPPTRPPGTRAPALGAASFWRAGRTSSSSRRRRPRRRSGRRRAAAGAACSRASATAAPAASGARARSRARRRRRSRARLTATRPRRRRSSTSPWRTRRSSAESRSTGRHAGPSLAPPPPATPLLQAAPARPPPRRAHADRRHLIGGVQMLIAAGRSKPDKHAEPRYVYPPHGPAEERLPPLPELPTPEPLPLSALGVDGAPDRLVMMWDFFNTLGPAIKLKPLGLPLEALENALLCRSPLDYDLASQLHACLLRLLIPDFDGLEGWGPWVSHLRDPYLPLSWPWAIWMFLQNVEEEAEAFDLQYGDGDDAMRREIIQTLKEGEWPALGPPLRLALLAWLVERVSWSETVRVHLDRNAESSTALAREVKQLLDEEEEAERQVAETSRNLAGLKLKLADAQQAMAKRSAGSGARGSAAALQKHNAGIAEEQTSLDAQRDELRQKRAQRLEQQELCASMALRSDTVGKDRHHRDYVQGGGGGGAFGASPQLLVREPHGGWGRLRGVGAMRELYRGLHPDGAREGALKTALGRRPLRRLVEWTPAEVEKHEAQREEKLAKACASKGLPPLYREDTAASQAAAAQQPASSSDADGKAAAPVPRRGAAPAPAQLGGEVAERLGAMRADLAKRCEGLPTDPLDPADRPLLRAAVAALEAAGGADALQRAQPVPPQAAAHFEQVRVSLLEFEDRCSGSMQAWVEQPSLQPAWVQWVRRAAVPRELALALLVLDAHLTPSLRTRMWGIERSAEWRRNAAGASDTMSDVVRRLIELDECCNWDWVEKDLLRVASERPAPGSGRGRAGGPPAPRMRRRLSLEEYARYKGERLAVLDWCDVSPSDRAVRARVHGELFSLAPKPGGGWEWTDVGPANDQFYPNSACAVVDLRGLTVGEAKGTHLTVWYEEEKEEKGKVDVPYVGVVIGVGLQQKGLTVRFDKVILPDGSAEVMPVTNDDDWLWGVHHSKPGKGGRIRDAHGSVPVKPILKD